MKSSNLNDDNDTIILVNNDDDECDQNDPITCSFYSAISDGCTVRTKHFDRDSAHFRCVGN